MSLVLVSCVIGLLAPQETDDRTYVVKGLVVSARDSSRMAMANVAMLNPQDSSVRKGVVAKKDGSFMITDVEGLDHLLRVSYAGHHAAYRALEDLMTNTGSDTIDIGVVALESVTTNIVEVTAERPLVEYQDGKKIFNVTESITTAGGNALDVLKQVPTVNVDLEGNVTVQGMSGVNIMIDGKPLSAYGNANQILKTLPAGVLEKVEVVTNPGSKYDAQGQGGILNIVLKKQRKSGFNGIVDLNLGVYDNYSGSTTMNSRNDDLNFFGGADFYLARQRRYRNVESVFDDGTGLLRTGTSYNNNHSYGLRLGSDITFDSVHSLTISAEARANNGTNQDPWLNTFTSSDGLAPSHSSMDQTSGGPNNTLGFTGTYTMHVGPKDHDLVANVYFYPDNYDITNTLVTTPTTSTGEPVGAATGRRSQTVGIGSYFEALADFTWPITSSLRIGMGVDATLQFIDSEFNFSELDAVNNVFVPAVALSNGAKHYDDVYAAYVDASEKFGDLNVRVGLRGEHTRNQFESRDTPVQNFDRSFGNLFPSMSASYSFTPEQSLQFSYSRRINRPSGPQLNPYLDVTDSLYWRTGNAALMPAYINSLQLGVLQYIDASVVNVEAFYRLTENMINLRFREEVKPGVLLERPYNFGQGISYGVSGSANLSLAPWLSVNSELSYYYQEAGGTFKGQTYESTGYGWNARVIANATLPLEIKSQVFFDYTAPQVIPQGERMQFSMFSLSMNREFKEQHLTVGLNWMDIFNSAQYGGSVSGPGFSTDLLNRRDYPLVSLNLSYRINDYKGPRPRQTPGVGGGGNTI
ncbi:MAG TPA: outer membrane beta-barrel family protein [Candidatus Didemnitutus sp.]|nr:outer membrane beta-barrel family protein [Candidatus Didemnitutus sp.]